MPVFRICQRPLILPNVHSTSFLKDSSHEEKRISALLLQILMGGTASYGASEIPIISMQKPPTAIRLLNNISLFITCIKMKGWHRQESFLYTNLSWREQKEHEPCHSILQGILKLLPIFCDSGWQLYCTPLQYEFIILNPRCNWQFNPWCNSTKWWNRHALSAAAESSGSNWEGTGTHSVSKETY